MESQRTGKPLHGLLAERQPERFATKLRWAKIWGDGQSGRSGEGDRTRCGGGVPGSS